LSANFPDQRFIPRRICVGNIEQFWTNEKLENGQKNWGTNSKNCG